MPCFCFIHFRLLTFFKCWLPAHNTVTHRLKQAKQTGHLVCYSIPKATSWKAKNVSIWQLTNYREIILHSQPLNFIDVLLTVWKMKMTNYVSAINGLNR